jgi:DMSO/TMAO reductase YedYZ molybdopterin-dependent catalytic subunit
VSIPRRRWLKGAVASVSASLLAGCNRITEQPKVVEVLSSAEGLTRRVQRLIGANALALEFSKADISPFFKPNGSTNPQDPDYALHVANNFANWRLEVDGLVDRPLSLSLDQLRALPARTQITRHDCVEGWSCIAEWTGVRMGPLIQMAGLKPQARHLVLYCADTLDGGAAPALQKYYETLDLVDVFHPQTILAYAMNGAPLDVPHGAPLRLRAERQLGYKQAKYVMRLEAVDRFDHIGGGKGGFWEDRDYERYAGI